MFLPFLFPPSLRNPAISIYFVKLNCVVGLVKRPHYPPSYTIRGGPWMRHRPEQMPQWIPRPCSGGGEVVRICLLPLARICWSGLHRATPNHLTPLYSTGAVRGSQEQERRFMEWGCLAQRRHLLADMCDWVA